MVSWRKGEHKKFTEDYEPKLRGKVQWVRDNLQVIVTHITERCGAEPFDAGGFSVRGAFVVNARTYTCHNTETLIATHMKT